MMPVRPIACLVQHMASVGGDPAGLRLPPAWDVWEPCWGWLVVVGSSVAAS